MIRRRHRFTFCRRALSLSLLCASVLCLSLAAPCQDVPGVRRVLLSPERLPQELEKLKQGLLIQLPREQLEEKLKQAALAASALKNPPRLVEARYQALLEASALVGASQWQVAHSGQGAGVLPLPSFNLALRQSSHPDREYVLAELDGKTPGLLLPEPGSQQVDLEWSARGEVKPDGLSFTLQLPPCPVAVLELYLPAGWSVTAQEGALLSGPHPLPNESDKLQEALPEALRQLLLTEPRLARSLSPDLRLWKVFCGGAAQVALVLRPTDRPGQTRLLVQRQHTTQILYADALEARYELDLEALNKGVREIVCECAPGLRPYAVSLRNLDSWEVKPGATAEAPSLLVLHLKEAIHEGTLQVSCLAPLRPSGGSVSTAKSEIEVGPASVAWTSPALHVLQAVQRGETVVLKIHPDLRVENWHSGGFRLTETATERDAERNVVLKRLTLVGGGVTPEGRLPVRPGARLQAHGVDFRARQLAWWQVGSGRMTLTAQISYEVSHGQLFQLPVQLPAGWDVERVDLSPASQLGYWNVRRQKERSVLLVDLQRPLSARARQRSPLGMSEERLPALADLSGPGLWPGTTRSTTLTIVLRSSPPRGASAVASRQQRRQWDFPDIVPLGARFREGGLAINVDPENQLATVQTPAVRSEPEEAGPWAKSIPDYFYLYRGQAPRGTLLLQPKPPRLRARCSSEVYLAAGRALIDSQLLLEATAGSPDTIDLYLSGHTVKTWTWRSATAGPAVSRAERLLVQEAMASAGFLAALAPLGPSAALRSAVLASALPTGQRWRITLSRPLRPNEPLLLWATGVLEPSRQSLEKGAYRVPLPVVLQAERLEGDVTLHLAGADLVQVQTLGLQELSGAGDGQASSARLVGSRGATAWRAFRYGELPLRLLLLTGQSEKGADDKEQDPARSAQLTEAALNSWLSAADVVQHRYTFQITGWPRRTLPLQLPAGSRLLAVSVNGRWLDQLPAERLSDETPVELPVPDPEEGSANPKGNAAAVPLPTGPERREQAGPVRRALTYEVVYVRAVSPWWLRTRVEAPLPTLPVQPLSLQRTWRLPAGVKALHTSSTRAAAAHAELSPAARTNGQSNYGAWLLSRLREAVPQSAEVGTEIRPWQPSAEAQRELRKTWGSQPPSLSSAIEQLAALAWKERRPLVIDTLALRQLGLRATSVLSLDGQADKLPWEKRGLATALLPNAVLLTSQAELLLWQPDSGPGSVAEVELAVQAALRHGYDVSGRFRDAWSFLPRSPSLVSAGDEGSRPLLAAAEEQWLEQPAGASVLLFYTPVLTALALGLSGLLLLVFRPWSRTKSKRRLAFLWLWLAGAGLGWIWLPPPLETLAWWPLAAGLVLTAIWYGLFLFRSAAPTPHHHASSTNIQPANAAPAATGAALALLLLCTGTWAEVNPPPTTPLTPPSYTVYLVPADKKEPNTQDNVLAPVELLEQLQTLLRAAPSGAGQQGSVLLSASYDGRLNEGVAQFDAVFQVLALGDETVAVLPLDGVALNGPVWLDDVRVNVQALPAAAPGTGEQQSGYAVKLPQRGRHKIELHFRVPVRSLTGTAEDRNVQFTVPRVPRSRLRFQSPPGAVALQSLTHQGWQRLTSAADPGRSGPVLDVDLGRVTEPVQLCWYHETGGEKQIGQVQFEEAYLWDLRGDASSLTGMLHYHVTQGTVQTLDLDLPPELEVRSAEAFRVVPHKGLPLEPLVDGSVRLRDWYVTGENMGRVLHLYFQGPVTGDLAVRLELLPGTVLPATLTLSLPSPRGRPLPGMSYLAYRTQGIEAQRTNTLRATGIQPAEFAPFWPLLARPPLRSLGSCFNFRREPGKPPLLTLRLSWPPPVVHASQDVQVRVGQAQAEVRATVELNAPNKDLVLVEWEVQSAAPWTVAGVFGPEVRRWSQTGDRLLIWLERTTGTAKVELAGWLTLTPDGSPDKPAGQKPNLGETSPRRLELPTFRILQAKTQKTKLRLTAEPGLLLSPLTLHGLQPVPGPLKQDVRTTELLFQSQEGTPGGTILIQPSPLLPGAKAGLPAGLPTQILTFVEVIDRQVHFSSTVVQRLRPGEARTLQIRLRDWPGEINEVKASEVKTAEAASEGTVREQRLAGGDRIWTVDVPPLRSGAARLLRVTLRGKMPLNEAQLGVWMPDVSLVGVSQQEHWLAVVGKELRTRETHGLTVLPDLLQVLAGWRQSGVAEACPRETERLRKAGSTVWQATAADWRLRLFALAEPQGAVSPLRIFLSEQTALVADGRRWVHESVYWIQQQASTDLNVLLPAAATVLAVALDGVEVTPLLPEPGRLWLPLSGAGGVRQVLLRFSYDEGAESLEHPRMEEPLLEGASTGPTLWTVHVPAGYTLQPGSRRAAKVQLKPGRDREAVLMLYRAAAQERICTLLSERSPDRCTETRLSAAAERLSLYCRLAERDLELAGTPAERGSGEEGPQGQSLSEWLTQLKTQAQKEAGHIQPEPAGQTRTARSPPRLDQSAFLAGVPYHGFGGADLSPPEVTLLSQQSQRARLALFASGEWLAALAAAWLFFLLPFLSGWLRVLWPEHLLALGGLCWYLDGPVPGPKMMWVASGLAAGWLLTRVLKLLLWLRG